MNKSVFLLAVSMSVCLLVSGTQSHKNCSVDKCNRVFQHGQVFKDFYSCNQCHCIQGAIACTKAQCPQEPCRHEEICYNYGEKMPNGVTCKSGEKDWKKSKGDNGASRSGTSQILMLASAILAVKTAGLQTL